ncbi:MAG: HTTM domain-containing protein [Myxococcota bacterium]
MDATPRDGARIGGPGAGSVEGVDPGPLVFFRIAFGLLMLWEVGRYFSHGWIGRLYVEPDFAFKYMGFEWLEPWPGPGMWIHFAGLGVCALGIATGTAYRLCAWGFLVGFTYVFLLDQALYLNHFYLICWLAFWLACLSPHRWMSVDARRRRAGARQPLRLAPAWWLVLLRVQVAAVYLYAGIAKLDGDWLAGSPLSLWIDWPDTWAFEALAGWPPPAVWGPRVMAWAGLGIDLLVVPGLLWRRTRAVAFGCAVAFHLTNAWLFSIGVFPWLMIAATALFLPPERFRLFSRPGGDRRPAEAGAPGLRLALAALLGLQLLIPLRHHLYPGDVTWTEEGHRFSWRMMLREKEGTARFLVVDAGGRWADDVDPRRHLAGWQVEEMAFRPDMVHQYARHLARRYPLSRPGAEADRPRVYARVSSTVNGRERRLLVDPQVDLGAQPRSLGPADWILPRTAPDPAR